MHTHIAMSHTVDSVSCTYTHEYISVSLQSSVYVDNKTTITLDTSLTRLMHNNTVKYTFCTSYCDNEITRN